MIIAIAPKYKYYKTLSVKPDMVITRWLSQIGDKSYDGSKLVLFDQFIDKDLGEEYNQKAAAEALEHIKRERVNCLYKDISLIDINVREVWAKVFSQVYREALCFVTCVNKLKPKLVLLENGDPWLFLFKDISAQLGLAIEVRDSFGTVDEGVSKIIADEYPTSLNINFHPKQRLGLKLRFFLFVYGIWSALIRLVRGKKPFVFLSLYNPLKPIKQQLIINSGYYPIITQLKQVPFKDLLVSGAKIHSYYDARTPDPKIWQIIDGYVRSVDQFVENGSLGSFDGHVSLDRILGQLLISSAERSFRQIAHNIDLLDNLFNNNDIRGYFGFCDTPWQERLIIRMCQKRGVPNAIMINGFLANSFYLEAKTADLTLVYGESMLKNYLKYKKSALAIGNPIFESAYQKRRQTKLAHPPKKILIGTYDFTPGDINCSYSCSEQYIIDVLRALSNVERSSGHKFDVALKLHPGENLAFYKWLLAEKGFLGLNIINSGDIQNIFTGYDLVIMPHSVALFEASLIGLPVIYYLPTQQVLFEPYNNHKDLHSASNVEDLVGEISKFVRDKTYAYSFTQEDVLVPFTGPLDNRSGQRIFNVINEYVEGAVK